jgi:membrane protease YdiL (CAAX protease family)
MSALTSAGWMHLVTFGIAVPLVVIRSKRHIESGMDLPPFEQHARLAVVQLAVFAAASVLVGWIERIELFPGRWPSGRDWLAGLALYAAAVGIMAPRWSRTVARRARVLRLFMPRTPRERTLWVLASAVAGFSEEITWRGVQFSLLWMLTDDPSVAAVVCAVMFGAAHMVQGVGASAAIVLFAFAFQLLVYFSGSLYVAMAVHFAYDVTAGLRYGQLGDELGYFDEARTGSRAGPDAAGRSVE